MKWYYKEIESLGYNLSDVLNELNVAGIPPAHIIVVTSPAHYYIHYYSEKEILNK